MILEISSADGILAGALGSPLIPPSIVCSIFTIGSSSSTDCPSCCKFADGYLGVPANIALIYSCWIRNCSGSLLCPSKDGKGVGSVARFVDERAGEVLDMSGSFLTETESLDNEETEKAVPTALWSSSTKLGNLVESFLS